MIIIIDIMKLSMLSGVDRAILYSLLTRCYVRYTGAVTSEQNGAQLPQPMWPLWGAMMLDADGAVIIENINPVESREVESSSKSGAGVSPDANLLNSLGKSRELRTSQEKPAPIPVRDDRFSLGNLFGGW